MGLFGRTKKVAESPADRRAEEAQFLIPKDVSWTVEDIVELERRGEHEEALARWRRLLVPFDDPAFSARIAGLKSHRIICQHIGTCCRCLCRYDEALEAYTRAERLAREAGDTEALAAILKGIGVVHRSLGDMDSALRTLERAREAARAAGDSRLVATVGDDVALCHGMQGRMDRALEESRQAYVAMCGKEATTAELETRLLGNLAVVHLEQGREREAVELMERALVKAREAGNAEQEALIRANLTAVRSR